MLKENKTLNSFLKYFLILIKKSVFMGVWLYNQVWGVAKFLLLTENFTHFRLVADGYLLRIMMKFFDIILYRRVFLGFASLSGLSISFWDDFCAIFSFYTLSVKKSASKTNSLISSRLKKDWKKLFGFNLVTFGRLFNR